MQILLSIITCLILVMPCIAEAYDVLVVQDQRSPTYDTILQGFRSVRTFKERVIVMQDYTENDLTRITREEHPALVLAVGGKALFEALKLRQTPVVSVFSYAIQQTDLPTNLVQIKMLVSAERFATLFRALGAKRVGAVLTPMSAGFAAEATESFRKAGIRLVVREAMKPGNVPKQLEMLKSSVDALWLLPDPAIVTSESVDAFALFSLQHRLPWVSFSDAHLKKGAIAAFGLDIFDLGRQAAETASSIMAGAKPVELKDPHPRKTRLRFNRLVLEQLGLPVDPLKQLGGSAAE
ncbi:MAG: ABC transporter substrate binding protein [Desulfuromonadales bacterium]